ncbi:mitochondrial carrier [Basidiobolus meristosporus CBS 931.73]|uniref:Mitochondrial aspartate-glutamate transporter AGC1 n=1 Tax=Basidiobolus meristosporus CBS 931.73 TaxID=1314790 RepID=A0A1Y1XII3_9FUNG|nr:mitochondrial carrier [Basidiobolus meristosporus CBS 931.73]|eukprot:ORX85571.1 mitochondrial carrier [Basidiobolus meristosporus CBS 931.73]
MSVTAESVSLPPVALSEEKSGTRKLVLKLVNGAIAGIVGTLIIYPLDMVKTRLQNQKMDASGNLRYKGGVHCFKTILKTEGARGLYRGLVPNLVGITPEKAIKLAVNDYAREYLARENQVDPEHLPIHLGMVAGATAGFCQVIATNPMEIVKIQMQVAGTELKPGQPRPTALQVVRKLGLKGVYKGTPATLLRDVPFSILFFPSHAYLKTLCADSNGNVSFPAVFGSGIVAGVIASGAVTPADVVKTRLQVAPKPGEPVYRGFAHCFKEIVRNEGPSALFKGIVPRCMIVSPLFGFALLTYEAQQRYLNL